MTGKKDAYFIVLTYICKKIEKGLLIKDKRQETRDYWQEKTSIDSCLLSVVKNYDYYE